MSIQNIQYGNNKLNSYFPKSQQNFAEKINTFAPNTNLETKSLMNTAYTTNVLTTDSPYKKARRVNIINFKGGIAQIGENSGKAACRGLWMHIAHLPAKKSFIGQFLDGETNKFIQFLHDSRQTHWIMNPLTTIGEDLCPYNSPSRFDRNKYFVNLNVLTTKKYGSLLEEFELPDDIPVQSFDLNMLKAQKNPRFEKAYTRFKNLEKTNPLKEEFKKFSEEQKFWLTNNSIYECIANFIERIGIKDVSRDNWQSWPDELKFFPEKTKGMSFEQKIETLKKIKIKDSRFSDKTISDIDIDKIGQFQFEQFLFNKQFNEQKEILKNKGIQLFVDLAYSVSPNGKDVWANKSIVELTESFKPKRYTGCMPESAYPDTQLWGNAVWNYDSPEFWTYQEASMRQMLNEGCIRLDHFGGLVNRCSIPATVTENGKTYSIFDALKTKEEGGFGKGFWKDEWLEDVSQKTNEKGENPIDMYLRLAEEKGLDPRQTFIVEDLGGVCDTPNFRNFMKKYGDKLAGLRLPYTYGIDLNIGHLPKDIGAESNVHNPCKFLNDENVKNIALLSGSHDPQSLMEITETLIKNKPEAWDGKANSPFHFRSFLKHQLGIKDEEMKFDETSLYTTTRKLLEWLYKRPARHVHTTISDALGLFFRPNIPGNWNGSIAKWQMRTGEPSQWNKVFPRDFLQREDRSGINPGYKKEADNFIKFMQDLFGKPQ